MSNTEGKKSFWDVLNPFEEKVEPVLVEKVENTNSKPIIDNLNNTNLGSSINNNSKEYFKKLMEELNIPGPDYFEFKKAVEALDSLPEDVAFNSVYSSFNVLGVTKEKLISAIEQYIKKIEGDKANFDKIISDKLNIEVKELRKKEEENNLKIANLQKEIDTLKDSNYKLVTDATNNESLINRGIIDYNSESKHLLFVLETDKQKIINLIK